MTLTGPVLIATALTEESNEALRQGVELADSLAAPWLVCHAVPEAFRVRVLFPQDAGVAASTQREIEQRAVDAVRVQVRAVVSRDLDAARVVIETGSPHAGILNAIARSTAGTVVVQPGATAARVARASAAPVLIARQSPRGGAVLGATDLSDPAVPALQLAIAEAARRSAPLRMVHCLDVDAAAYLAIAGATGVIATVPYPAEAIQQLENDAAKQLREAAGSTGAETVVSRHSPHAGILHEASQVETSLIVVGTHGRSGLARLALGSVAEHVMRDAPCSVLVVPLHQAQASGGSGT